MKRIKTEILHYKQGNAHDKVYILEIVYNEDNKQYYLYASYGKRTMQNLIKQQKVSSDYKYEAEREFNKLLRKKQNEGYRTVENGSRLDIPGFKASAEQTKIAANLAVLAPKDEPKEEHRRFVL